MNKILLILSTLLLTGLFSCNKNKNVNIVSGVYTESTPLNGRTKLEFTTDSKMIKTESGSSTQDVYEYKIADGKIELTPTWDNSLTTELELKNVSNSQFEIENIYPSIPEDPKTFMTFVR